jgi:hypothetical protein
MANTDRPNGFKPVKHLSGAPYNGQANKYAAPAAETTAIGIGDLVIISTKPTLTPGKVPGVESIGTSSVTSGALVGCVVGVLVVDDTGSVSGGASPGLDLPQYKAASTLKYVLVADAPDLVFEAQEDSVGGTNFALADIGLNIAIQGGAASTTTGLSAQELDSSVTPTTTNSLPLRVVGLVDRPDNEVGTNARWQVVINTHAYGGTVTAPSRD